MHSLGLGPLVHLESTVALWGREEKVKRRKMGTALNPEQVGGRGRGGDDFSVEKIVQSRRSSLLVGRAPH
jgi:hypothetical protein